MEVDNDDTFTIPSRLLCWAQNNSTSEASISEHLSLLKLMIVTESNHSMAAGYIVNINRTIAE